MRLLQAHKRSLRNVASTYDIAHPQSIELTAQDCRDRTVSRHDAAQMFTARTAPADPYTAWLKRREADREREAHTLNPRAAWDDLRTQGFCGSGAVRG